MKVIPIILNGMKVETDTLLDVVNPWTLETIAQCCLSTEKHVQEALEIGNEASVEMRKLKNYQKADILHKTADGLRELKDEFAMLICQEGGKPIVEARAEAARAESTFRIAAELGRNWGGEWLPTDVSHLGGKRIALVKRFPLGLVTGISPFNFPLNLVAHKVAPALAVGNAINLKPASSTPLTALRLAELMLDCGLPKGAFNVLPMKSQLAKPLVVDKRVKAVTFTGSFEVGWKLKEQAFDKRVCLELGGNGAVIVENDADLDFALKRILMGGYAYTGQICISVQHVLLHKQIYNKFVERFVPMVMRLKMGDPMNEDTNIAAMIDENEAIRVENWVNEAVTMGATKHCGGDRTANRLTPVVLTSVPKECSVYKNEVFGPVTVISPYSELNDAIDIVNHFDYGLQCGIFTVNIQKAMNAFEKLDVGGVIINDVPTFRVDNFPYGGVKKSGFGREGVKYTMEELTELKTAVIPLD